MPVTAHVAPLKEGGGEIGVSIREGEGGVETVLIDQLLVLAFLALFGADEGLMSYTIWDHCAKHFSVAMHSNGQLVFGIFPNEREGGDGYLMISCHLLVSIVG
jgi:hypothetical protein